MTAPLRILDACSGIGGFSYAAEYLSGRHYETAAFIEFDPYCQQVLRKRWPNTPVYGDIKEYEYDEKRDGTIDILTAGYPCQPFSNAGLRTGTEDDRHIWPEVLRLLKDARPPWCIFENVYGHLSMGVRQVLSDMEEAGYSARIFLIPALAVDAKHQRDRIWIIATDEGGYSDKSFYKLRRKEVKRTDEPLLMTPTAKGNQMAPAMRNRRGGWGEENWPTPQARDHKGYSTRSPNLPNAAGEGSEKARREKPELFRTPMGSPAGDVSQYVIDGKTHTEKGRLIQVRLQDQIKALEGDGTTPEPGRLNPDWVEWLMGYPTGYTNAKVELKLGHIPFGYQSWTDEPEDIPRLTEAAVFRSKRIKSLGNSIVPQVAARFFNIIASVEDGYQS